MPDYFTSPEKSFIREIMMKEKDRLEEQTP